MDLAAAWWCRLVHPALCTDLQLAPGWHWGESRDAQSHVPAADLSGAEWGDLALILLVNDK